MRALEALPGEGLEGKDGSCAALRLSRGWTGKQEASLSSTHRLFPFSSGHRLALRGQEPGMWIFSWAPFSEPVPLIRKLPEVRYLQKRAALCPPEQGAGIFTLHTGHQGTVSKCRLWSSRAEVGPQNLCF